MSQNTVIEWTDATWNPVTGCSKVSAGCAHCYAEGVAKRFWGNRKFTDVQVHPERLNAPLNWRNPKRIFVNSMSDLFHEDVPGDFIARVFSIMRLAKHHTFQILTKRPERMKLEILSWENLDLPVNVWIGVSVEDQAAADKRIPLLLQTPAAVRFVSCEPMLGPMNLAPWLRFWKRSSSVRAVEKGLDLVIVGGESGPGARPFNIEWGRSLRDQCKAAGVSFFMKQLGAWPLFDFANAGRIQEGHGKYFGIKDRKGGDMSEWPEDLRVREFPA